FLFIASESVHVVSLQAQKALGQSLPNNGAATAKTSPPEPPEYEAQDISVRVMSAKSVLISWVDPHLMQKMIRFREKGESARWEYKESNQRRIMIDTLSADGMYEFSVRISQGEKQGKWSVSVFQRTPESAPSGPPENFEVKPLRGKGTAVISTWDPPEEPNGRIREYILSYAPAIKPFGMKTITYREGTTKATIDGLTPGERYIFKIRATNRRGMGPQSKAFSVAMPRSSGTASSLSKPKDTQTTSKTIIKQDIDKKSDLEPTEVPEGPITTPKPHNTNRRLRPLSQTRSYHSIFSSIRGSVRNTANRGSARGAEREHEEQVDDKKPTTPSPVAETTTVVPEIKELDNNVSPLSEEEVDYNVEPLTTETPSLKVLTPSPTKSAFKRPYRPNRRPIKIRVHQKTGSKSTSSVSSADSSSSSSSSSTSSSSSSATSPVSSTSENSFSSSSRSSLSHTSLLPSSHIPESEPSKKDNIESTNHETAKIHQKPNLTSTRNSLTHGKPLIVVNSQETESTLTDTSSSVAERSSNAGSRFGSRYGYGRRQPGSFFRGNSTRLLNGNKPVVTTQFHLPSQSNNQVISNTGSSDKTQSALTERSQNHETSNPSDPKSSKSTSRSTLESQTTSDSSVFDKSHPASESRSHGSKLSQNSQASTSHSSPIHNLNTDISGSSQSVSQRRSSSTSQNNKNSRGSDTSSNRDISLSKRTENTDYNNKDDIESKAEGSTLNSRAQTTQDSREEDRQDESSNKKTVGPRTRISSSFAERFPWLASHYPGRFTSSSRTSYPRQDARTPLTRVSSSVGAERPLLRKTPTRVSGEAGDSRVPLKQETTEDLKVTSRPDSMKNSVILNSGKSSLPNQHAVTGDTRNPTTVSSTETLMSSNSGSLSLEKSSVLRDFSEVTHKEISKSGDNMRENVDTLNTTSSHGSNKAVGQKFITGPDGTRWVVDLEKGVLMNQDGQVLQDSQGKAKRVVLGEDGRTIFDHMGSPLVSQEGIALFGHGRDSQPVVNPKDKVLMIGGKPVLGLDVPPPKTSTTTTTLAPTTTLEPTTDWTTEDFSTALPYPTCPPGTFSKTDEFGYPILDPEGILDCYPEGENIDKRCLRELSYELLVQTTLPPTTTTIATTTTTTTVIPTTEPQVRVSNRGPVSEFDLSGKKRFTAPFVNYIQKDPGAPCSLTEALEYLQVDVLENLMEKDRMAVNQNQPPKHKPQNFTVVAMEGCHSFIILDWAKPLKDDMVSGYMVHSASYDDVLNNRWSSKISNGTHLPVENLKPNSRYYFKVQAKNVFGLGPFSETLTYVTESDDPLLIDRPPGGEPIWIPFTFKYNTVHSSCKGSQYVKRTWYRKFVGVVLCNSLRYKIFMGDGLREPFYSIGDTLGQGEDHCQFVDSHKDGRTGPAYLSETLPTAQGYYRAYRQEPVTFGVIGRRTSHPFVGWYECGVPIPGKW
uniref:Fibronectin type III domain containing 1 n=1 Tax=Xiphophorus couchianus TaxID=32473 RepID=A0A3B5L3Z6_9TELE